MATDWSPPRPCRAPSEVSYCSHMVQAGEVYGSDFGQFPFGQLNRVRPMRRPSGEAHALVVGVYPSAFHIAWSPPSHLDPRLVTQRARPYIGSLAVDVEPIVFWNGQSPSPAELLEQWKVGVGFTDEHGIATVGNNGPSGAGLVVNVLEPLGLDADDVAFTDAVPWFFVKDGAGSQGEAIRERFGPIAASIGAAQGSIPKRPTTRQLVELANGPLRRDALRAELVEAAEPLVITLGQEALDAIRAVADRCDGVQVRLAPSDDYGSRGHLVVGGHRMRLLPLVHPGFQRQTARQDWKEQLKRWDTSVRNKRD
jgi:hypothetical protein